MEQANLELLAAGLRQYGVAPTDGMLHAIGQHLQMVAEWNEQVNLTAITAEREMVVKHAIDSASALGMVEVGPGARVLDVGTGAGFPGVTLKCIQPEATVVLLESLAKRCKFLEAVGTEVIAPLGGKADAYQVVWGRAEDKGQDKQFRERFDLVVARAVAELRVLSEYCLPFAKVGGEFLAMKGPSGAEELAAAKSAIATLGGEVVDVKSIVLPEEAGARTLIRVKKVKATPKEFPRKAGTPAKKPL
ncbi:MAG TPA: 16S rRNA (guanine(527)-N(7))-methyltransferase RsmG [Symbiobacteriaceae bacterium]|nr:16S rRNA (guanine(527)-N(7))-methyltransferase RsmG [Symbiobacteriaceae bacterium]